MILANLRPSHLRTLALLGFALFGPAALPAGGAELRAPEVRRRQRSSEPFMAPGTMLLRCSPQRQAPVIAEVETGYPLRLLRRCSTASGQHWLQVELPFQLLVGAADRRASRGWLPEVEC